MGSQMHSTIVAYCIYLGQPVKKYETTLRDLKKVTATLTATKARYRG